MKYEAALFDLDGTVLDTLADLHSCVNASLAAFGLPERSLSEVRSFLGEGIKKLIDRAAPPGTDENTAAALFDCFCGLYKDRCADSTRLYDGVADAVARIRALGVKTALVSNKSDFAVRPLSEKFCKGMFDFVTGLRDGFRRKPFPDMPLAALSALGAAPERAIYIGDSETDSETAKNLGCDCALVTWGFREKDALAALSPRYLVTSPEKLSDIFSS